MKRKNDIIFISAVLLVAFVGFLVFNAFQTEGKYAQVIVDGEVVAQYPLDKDITEEITPHNNQSNVLFITNGKAFIAGADCPDKICVKHRGISKVGETITCLPHKLVIKISADKSEELDIVI